MVDDSTDGKRNSTGGMKKGLRERWRLFLLMRGLLVVALCTAGAGLIILTVSKDARPDTTEPSALLWLGIVVLAAAGEYIDSAIGMGFGTVMAPVLILMGFRPAEVIVAVLASEVVSGGLAGYLHQRAANFDLSVGSPDREVVATAVPIGMFGALAAGLAASRLDAAWTEAIVGIVIAIGGLMVLAARRTVTEVRRSHLLVVGAMAAVAKGLSSAGFGPVLTTGQLMIGRPERNVVGVTSIVEAPVSAVALAVFSTMVGWPSGPLVPAVVVGGIAGVFPAIATVRLLPLTAMRAAIGYASVFLGALAVLGVLV